MDIVPITLGQIAPLCGIGNEYIYLIIEDKESSENFYMRKDNIFKILSEKVLNGRVSYIGTYEDHIKLTVKVN